MEQEREKILEHYPDPMDKVFANQIIDKLERVSEKQEKVHTDFLDPHQVEIAESLINSFADVAVVFHGGFPRSERNKGVFFPKSWNWTPGIEEIGIEVLEIEGRFEFETITHRDVLGAVLGLGLKREKVGDIQTQLKLEKGLIYVALDTEIASYVVNNLTKIKHTGVTINSPSFDALPFHEEYTKEIMGTVSSLRLDSVASVGFGASRSKMNQLIKAERVKLNWKPVKDPKIQVEKGDMISLKGKGRVQLEDVGGKSRKGRTHVIIKKYKS